MSKNNIFKPRVSLQHFGELNQLNTEIPIIFHALSEELTTPEDYRHMSDKERKLAALQLFIKKGKMFSTDNIKVTPLASSSVSTINGVKTIPPASIYQNQALFDSMQDKSEDYIDFIFGEKELKSPSPAIMEKLFATLNQDPKEKILQADVNNQNRSKTPLEKAYLNKSIETLEDYAKRVFLSLQKTNPPEQAIIHIATMERDLSMYDSGKNRLTACFKTKLIEHLSRLITQNKKAWQLKDDRVFGLKQRTSRAESYGIQRIAQQPLTMLQSTNHQEQITENEFIIIVDDHIQAGAAIADCYRSCVENKVKLVCVACITVHRNAKFFTLQKEVRNYIEHCLPKNKGALEKLESILGKVGVSFDSLTNMEGLIIAAILSDPDDDKQRQYFYSLLNIFDMSANELSLFEKQTNSFMTEFNKPVVPFSEFEKELDAAIEKGRYTVDEVLQPLISDEYGQSLRAYSDKRSKLPWLLFDFDDTLHNLSDGAYLIFQEIIKEVCGMTVSIETIKETRATLKEKQTYQYQAMILDFIKQHNPNTTIRFDEITEKYRAAKIAEPFKAKLEKNSFLKLWNKYRIGIISDGSEFESKLEKIKAFYGVDIDGYTNAGSNLPKKPNRNLFDEFFKKYQVNTKVVAFVGDNPDRDGELAKAVNVPYIEVNANDKNLNIEYLEKSLLEIENKKVIAKNKWIKTTALLKKQKNT